MIRATLVIVCGLSVVIPNVSGQSSSSVPDITGYYKTLGQNPDGKEYEGLVHIRQDGQAHVITWAPSAESQQVGIGILKSNVLSVSFSNLTSKGIGLGGVISYSLDPSGKLIGEWTDFGKKLEDSYRVYKEVLTKLQNVQVLPVPPKETPKETPPQRRQFGVAARTLI
ncbi:MAG: hypothetical protein WAX44_03230 [Minisyncoccia bacterium]